MKDNLFTILESFISLVLTEDLIITFRLASAIPDIDSSVTIARTFPNATTPAISWNQEDHLLSISELFILICKHEIFGFSYVEFGDLQRENPSKINESMYKNFISRDHTENHIVFLNRILQSFSEKCLETI